MPVERQCETLNLGTNYDDWGLTLNIWGRKLHFGANAVLQDWGEVDGELLHSHGQSDAEQDDHRTSKVEKAPTPPRRVRAINVSWMIWPSVESNSKERSIEKGLKPGVL